MSLNLNLFGDQPQEPERPLYAKKRVAAAVAAVCLVASAGIVAARHGANKGDSAVPTDEAPAAIEEPTSAAQPESPLPDAAGDALNAPAPEAPSATPSVN